MFLQKGRTVDANLLKVVLVGTTPAQMLSLLFSIKTEMKACCVVHGPHGIK